MSRKYIIELLRGIEEVIPPPPDCHHALTYARLGSEDRLALHINKSGTFRCLFLDDLDFATPPEDLVLEISEMLELGMV